MPSRPVHRRHVLALAVALALAGGVAADAVAQAAPPVLVAQGNPDGPRWNELSPAQRQALAPLAGEWNGIDARGKERWLGVAGRFPTMPPAEQQRANERMSSWARLSPAERTQARMNFQEWRGLSPQEREDRWRAYQALPEDQKRALASQAAQQSAPGSRNRAAPLDAVQPKRNMIDPVPAPRVPLEPGSTVLRTQPGATTTLINRRPGPGFGREAQPKIAGSDNVDRRTLLPRRGPQAAGGGRDKDRR